MKSTLVISDVHGSLCWKDALANRCPGAKVVFLGDYFDRRGRGPFSSDDAENFLEICDYASRNPDTILLAGNHDYHYMTFAPSPAEPWGPREDRIRKAVMSRLDMLNMVYIDRSGPKPAIFSHGGLTQTFLDLHGLNSPEEVNVLWISRPESFDWIARDPISGEYSALDGDNIWQSPIWARDMALLEDGVPGYDQIVGHTPVREPEWFKTARDDSFLLTCTLDETIIRLP
ncbi:MAG: metallophosphoesterase [Desulfovibrio sp.]|nr:metallophosphoesterase [Desulfovibrio sp.]